MERTGTTSPPRLIVEAKSSRTASSDMLTNANALRAAVSADDKQAELVVAFGGDEDQSRSAGRIVSWRRLHEIDWGGGGSGTH